MTWLLFIALAVFSLSVAIILQRVLMKDDKSDVYSYLFVSQLISALFLFGIVLFTGYVPLPLDKIGLNLVILAVLYGAGNLFLFKTFQKFEAGEAVILTSLTSLWAIVGGIFFLGESFTFTNLIGTLLIFSAIVMVSLKGKGITLSRDLIYPMLFAICFGLAIVNDSYSLRYAETFSYTAIGFLLPPLFVLLVRPALTKKLSQFKDIALLRKMAIMSVFYAIQALFFYMAFSSGAPVTLAAPLSRSVVIVTVILGAIFLKERDHLFKKFIAALLVVLGVILLT